VMRNDPAPASRHVRLDADRGGVGVASGWLAERDGDATARVGAAGLEWAQAVWRSPVITGARFGIFRRGARALGCLTWAHASACRSTLLVDTLVRTI